MPDSIIHYSREYKEIKRLHIGALRVVEWVIPIINSSFPDLIRESRILLVS